MKTTLIFFKVFIVGTWLLSFFATGNQKLLLMSLAAGWGAGTIIADLWIQSRRSREFGIKVFDSRTDEIPPEVKAELDKVTEMLIKSGTIPPPGERKKCDNPHCPGCWGLGDGV